MSTRLRQLQKTAWRDTNISARIRHFTVQLFLILICQRWMDYNSCRSFSVSILSRPLLLSVRWRKRAHGKQFRHWNTGHSISLQNRKIIWKRKAKALENVFMRCLMLRPALKRHLKESVLLPYPEPYRQEAAGLHREKRRMKLQENSAAWRAQKL